MTLLTDLLDRIDAIGALPPEVEACAANHILDITGVAIAAASTKVGAPWRAYGETALIPDGPATILGMSGGARPAEAALVNGGLMHSLEYDDTHTASIVHGSSVLASTALAVAEAEGSSGREMLRAYAIWYEVLIRLGLSAAGGFQNRGFQVTSVGGALCAAGIAAQLRGLSRGDRAAAVGIALSQASGVFAFLSNGATVKSMHPGWAAHSGIKAADLAAAGISGPDRPFEDVFGLFAVFAGDRGAAERFGGHLGDLGRTWHLPAAAYKFLPCCHYIHPFVEAAENLAEQGIAPADIEEISFGVPAGAAAIICEPWDEKCRATGHQARWSLPVVVAMQLVDGQVGLDSFDRAPAPDVHRLATRSRWEPLADSAFPAKFDAALRLRLTSGEMRERRIEDVYGNASRPASDAAIANKFTTNISRQAAAEDAARLGKALRGIAQLSDLGPVTRLLRSASAREQEK
ncbi:MmgE/PrpD family protein [Actibacterium sp. MT2.3-13A]|uniref:MmgE/PrpD family protein n=1 Tax=Actibacterium sp. MT2.3-13A TaxID=2828332 RepID=UPI001BAE089C|nr:MmgE/PrpD family protein [Actibacterium sp. MT2.3-13A]